MWYLIGSVKRSSTKEEKAPTARKDTDISIAEAKVDLKIPVKDVECAKKSKVSKESWVLERKTPAIALGQKKFRHVPKKNWQKFSGWKSL